MKILVFSDSHGAFERMYRVFCDERCDEVIFLGDGVRDAQRLYDLSGIKPVRRVCGNCDFFAPDVSDELVLELRGVKTLITHGHKYGVKNGLGLLESRARTMDLVLFGHTHVQLHEQREGITFVNPGSIADGRYAVIDISERITVNLKRD